MSQLLALLNYNLPQFGCSPAKRFYSMQQQQQDDCLSVSSDDSGKDSVGSASTQDSFGCAGIENLADPRQKNFLLKRKTELCKTYSLGIVCPYGDKCSFAHGTHELKGKLLVPARYKTVKCRDFHRQGYCQYGPRCQFLHKEHESTKPKYIKKMSYKQSLKVLEAASETQKHQCVEHLFESSLNLPSYNLPRLPIFQFLSKQDRM